MANVAMRKGIKAEQIVRTVQTPKDDALFRLAKGLVSGDLKSEDIKELQKYYSDDKLELVALSVCLAGYLNLMSKSISLQLDKKAPLAVCERFTESGWAQKKNQDSSDEEESGEEGDSMEADAVPIPPSGLSIEKVKPETLSSFLHMAKHAPHAMYVESCWLHGVPKSLPRSQSYLKKHAGYNFPILKKIKNAKAVQTLTAILKDHFDPTLTEIGLVTKAMTGLTFASTKRDEAMLKEAIKLTTICARREDITVDPNTLSEIGKTLSQNPVPDTPEKCEAVLDHLCSLDGIYTREMAAAIVLARAASSSPCEIPSVIVDKVARLLSPEAIMEVITYVGHQQCLQRIHTFVRARQEATTPDSSKGGGSVVYDSEDEEDSLKMPPATKISVDDLTLMQHYRREQLRSIREDTDPSIMAGEGSDPSIGRILTEVDGIISDDDNEW
jgi:hypothetical protein